MDAASSDTKNEVPFARQIEAFHSIRRARSGNDGLESVYLKTLWRPELAYLSAADYLERRDFFFSLCAFCPLEHPILGGVRARLAEPGTLVCAPPRKRAIPSFEAKPFGAYDLFSIDRYELYDALHTDKVLFDTFFKARRDIVRCIYTQFDEERLGLGFRSDLSDGPSVLDVDCRPKILPTTTQKRFAAFSAAWAERTGKPACFAYGRMYRAPENPALDVPPSRLQKKAKVAPLPGGPGCSLVPASRIDVLEAACATLPKNANLSLHERAAQVESFCDSLALTWETTPLFDLRDLDAWEAICKQIDGIFGKTLWPGTLDGAVEYFWAKGIALTKGRFLAVDLLWDETDRRGDVVYHLQPGWKNRIKILREIRAAQSRW